MPIIRHPRRGFTLVELLVVIAVIATLMGLLIPSVMFVQSKAKRTKTQAYLSQIQAALKSFKDVNGIYPEVSSAPALHTKLITVDRETFRSGELKDAYGTEIRYRHPRDYPFTKAGDPGAPPYPEHINGDNPPGADSFQLWSCGPNNTDNVTSSLTKGDYGDDIVTWK